MKTILIMGALAVCAFGQTFTEPPPILELIRKPGIGGAPPRNYNAARAAVNVIGMTAVTGLPETWLVEAHLNYASVEDLDKSVAAVAPLRITNNPSDPMQDDVLAPSRTMLALYRPGWSYRPDQASRLFEKARYFFISIYRVRAGTEADFGELVKLRRLNQDSINLDRPEIAYQIVSGAPAGTFLFLAPVTTLRSLDEGVPDTPVYAEALAEARAKARTKVAPDSELSREHLLFRVEPRLSYVSDDFAAADPEFWRPKQ